MIDLRTLMFISGITSILLCICMVYVYFTQKIYGGFLQWVIAFFSLAVGMILLSQRGIIPDLFTIILANLFLILFAALLTHGLSSFAGMKQRNGLYLSLLAAYIVMIYYFTYVQPNFNIRVMIFSGSSFLCCACALVIVLRDIPHVLPGKDWFLIVYFTFNSAWFFLRMIISLINEGVMYEFWIPSILEKATMIVSLEVSIMGAIGLIIINSKRVGHELFLANSEIKTLEGFIPICANCKNIRDDKGYWNQLEKYISEHTDAMFSHSICPECAKKLYPDHYEKLYPEYDK